MGASQGLNILLNLFFGVTVNAAMGIACLLYTSVKRRDRSERPEHPCLSEASWDATASVGLEVARQRQP